MGMSGGFIRGRFWPGLVGEWNTAFAGKPAPTNDHRISHL